MRSFTRLTGLIAAAIIIAGCAGLMPGAARPRLNIADIQPKDLKLMEQVFTMDLRIQNPGDSPIDIKGLVFSLEINDAPFASGVSDTHLTVPPFSSRIMQVEAVTMLFDIFRQLSRVPKGTEAPRLKYRLKGAVHTGSALTRIPFDETGEISGLPE